MPTPEQEGQEPQVDEEPQGAKLARELLDTKSNGGDQPEATGMRIMTPREQAIETVVEDAAADFKSRNPNAMERDLDNVRRARRNFIAKMNMAEGAEAQIDSLYAEKYRQNAEGVAQRIETESLTPHQEELARATLDELRRDARDAQQRANDRRSAE